MNPKAYIKSRGLTLDQAAGELGCTRQHLTQVLNRKMKPGRRLAENFEEWSGGLITKEDFLWQNWHSE